MQLKLNDLMASPAHFLFAFDEGRAVFAEMDRASYARSIFVDGRISAASSRRVVVNADQLAQRLDQNGGPVPPTGYIFHVAHCGSTLLARALDVDRTLVIREPMALRQLAVEGVNQRRDTAWQSRLRLTLRMMGRRYDANAPVIVKANVPVNFVLDDILALMPAAPVMFLYYPLEPYLLAILRSENHQAWVASVTAELAPALDAIEPVGTQAMTPAQSAARLWLAQIRVYDQALARHANSISLDAETLFDTPGPVLEAAARHFGVTIDARTLKSTLEGALFSTYSKNPSVTFDNASRLARQATMRQRLGGELAQAYEWVSQRIAGRPLPEQLARPLTGQSPLLIDNL